MGRGGLGIDFHVPAFHRRPFFSFSIICNHHPFISITARVTPWQTSQVGAILSKTTDPSGLTSRT